VATGAANVFYPTEGIEICARRMQIIDEARNFGRKVDAL
jgi:hypothetical protein